MAYQFNPPDRNTPSTSARGDEKGTKYRIYQVFKPTVVLDEMSLPQTRDDTPTQKVEDYVSMQLPFVKINDYFVSESELDSLTIDQRNFLPTITLQISFTNELFYSKDMPKDGDVISIMIRNKSDVLTPIRNDYVITSAISTGRATSSKLGQSMTLFGELFVPGLKSYLGSASFRGTSMEVLKETARQLQLGFATNENETDDHQIWLIADTPNEFIKDVTSKAWKNENSFFDCWIDIYYNLNFVNVQKQLLSAEDEVDIGAALGNVDKEWYWGSKTKDNEVAATPKVFSNYAGYRTTSFYVTNWKPTNRSSAITFEYGTSMNASFFEHLDNLYPDPEAKKYWNIEIAPDYDPEKVDSYILLRGRATYDASINDGELARANYSYVDLYKTAPWLGIQYTINDPDADNLEWSGNVHSNYMRAQVHNVINLVELDKLNVDINVQGTNMNIIKGDKIPVVLIKKDPVEVKLAYKEAEQSSSLDFFYSGWYIVKGMTLNWQKTSVNDSIFSNYSQNFVLTRREWPTPEPVEPIKDTPEDNTNSD